jgi:hypothetical protein
MKPRLQAEGRTAMKARDPHQSADWRMKHARGERVDLQRLARYRARKKGYRAFLLRTGTNDPLDGLWVLVDQRTAAVLLGTAATVEEILEFLDRDDPVSRSRLS